MEIWFLYALISMIVTGFFNFGFKIITKRNYNTSYVSIISYATSSVLAAILYFTNSNTFDAQGLIFLIIISIANVLFYFLSTICRVEALHKIDTTIFFPVYKTIFPVIMTIASFFYFKESLSIKEAIGVFLGILVPLMLITKSENKIQQNLKVGIILCLATSILAAISASANKYISVLELDKNLFILLSFYFGTLISSLSYRYFDNNEKKKYSQKGIYLFSCILGVLQFLGFVTFTYALQGNMAIVITLNSFSILIPIVLSVVFYSEEMTLRKAFIIFLSIITILLFV